MKFDELFNKIMNKFDVVTEDAEDIYDPESAGEPDPVEITSSPITPPAGSNENNAGPLSSNPPSKV